MTLDAARPGTDGQASPASGTAVAVIGVGCRFPGASSPESLWHLLRDGRSSIAEVPAERFGALDGWVSREPAVAGKMMSRWMGALPELDRFDAAFFGIAPREADRLDPQQRLVLEVGWEALEDAGVRPSSLEASSTGIYLGSWLHDYETRMLRDPMMDDTRPIDFYMTTGSGQYSIPGRLSFFLGAQGPSVAVDTACSSSLVALHLACQSLREGESSLAIAGGVNTILTPYITIAYSQSRMMSPDGRCKFGDASADGYVRSEGCGLLVLKRLDQALADGDTVRAVILGSAVNNDGRSSGYLATPGEGGQRELLRAAYARAGVAPSIVSYVEAHGTGTPAGDPVELAALGGVLGDGRAAGGRCAVGSVKSNLGHTEGAAGAAGMIKVVLAMDHHELPASLHVESPTTAIDWTTSPMALQREHAPWIPDGTRVAGVSAFGIAGTNAHVVVAEPTDAARFAPESRDERPQLLMLSAHTADALRQRVGEVAEWLESGAGAATPFHVTARTAAVRRDHFPHRVCVVAADAGTAARALRDVVIGSGSATVQLRRVAFVFPGQGSQWAGMGSSLLQSEPVFAAAIDACATSMQPYVEWSLRDVLTAGEIPDDIGVIQPAIFALQVALAALWRSWGVEPVAVVGHSMGEVAAAFVAGALTLDDACRIICLRSRLMRQVRGAGGMAVVELSEAEASDVIAPFPGRLALAAINSPRSTVLAGDRDALETLLAQLAARGTYAQLVRVDMASHSHHVEPLLHALRDALQPTAPMDGDVSLYSTVHGSLLRGSGVDAAYWGANLRRTVRLTDAVQAMIADGIDTFIEVSPHPLLTTALDETLAGHSGTCVIPSLKRDSDGRAILLQSLGALYTVGATPPCEAAFAPGRTIVALPTFPWQRERFWFDQDPAFRASGTARVPPAVHRFLGARIETAAGDGGTEWDVDFGGDHASWLSDHVVRGASIVPATAIIDLFAAATRDLLAVTDSVAELHDVELRDPVPRAAPRGTLRIVATHLTPERLSLELRSREATTWRVMASATGKVSALALDATPSARSGAYDGQTDNGVDSAEHYDAMSLRRLDYGPAFRVVSAISLAPDGARMTLSTQASAHERRTTVLLDGALQVLLSLAPLRCTSPHETLVPVRIARVRLCTTEFPHSVRAQVVVEALDSARRHRGSALLVTDDGTAVAELSGVEMAVIRPDVREEFTSLRYSQSWTPLLLTATAADGARRWLIVHDGDAVSSRVVQLLREGGDLVHEWGTVQALSSSSAIPMGMSGMVICTPLGVRPAIGAQMSASLERALESAYDVPLACLQHIESSLDVSLPVMFVTSGAVAVHDGAEVTSSVEGASWGLARVARQEHPTPGCRILDVGAASSPDAQARPVVQWLQAVGDESEVAWRDGAWWAGRVVRVGRPDVDEATPDRHRLSTAERSRYVADVRTPGLIESTGWRAVPRRALGDDEVAIAVHATGLNFRDVLSVLADAPNSAAGPVRLGLECAGIVSGVGASVRSVTVGERVMAVAEQCLASDVTAKAALCVPIPENISMEEASGFPIAFLTAARALEDLARVQPGECVLIHSAAGGVGLAAIQLATRLGARVFATAGTPEKRALLMSLGVEHVFDSRTLDWGEDVMAATGGRGVDVVLNSLAGAAIDTGLRVLAPRGRFIEIGMRDVVSGRRISMDVFRRQIIMTAVDLLDELRWREGELGTLLARLTARLASGELRVLPTTRWAAVDIVEAIRFFLPGTHVGKAVVVHGGAPLQLRDAHSVAMVRSDATYLVTGGMGAIGRRAARWLVARGARRVVLVGRSAPTADVAAMIESLRETGAAIEIVTADIATEPGIAIVAARLRTLPALAGVFHAAGGLDDGMIAAQTPLRRRNVTAAKVTGAWQLAMLPGFAAVDFVVFYSSVAATLGTRGQANYAAANAVLDAEAHALRARGIRATSIALGPVADAGLASDARRLAGLRASGIGAVRLAHVDAALDALVASDAVCVMVAQIDPAAWVQSHHTPAERRRFSLLLTADAPKGVPLASVREGLRARLAAIPGPRQRSDAMLDFVRGEVAMVLRSTLDRVDPAKALKALGLDSLTALELRNRLELATELRLPGTLVYSFPTASAIATHVLHLIEAGQSTTALTTPPTTPLTTVPAVGDATDGGDLDVLARELGHLDADEVRRLLAEPAAGGNG